MSDNNVESEEDSDIEQQGVKNEVKKAKAQYIHTTRGVGNKAAKRKKLEPKEIEIDPDNYEVSDESDDEAYMKMLNKPVGSSDEEEEKEDDFQRQLRLEREEALRVSKEKKEEKKTRIDADGTEYEWDPAIKGWFPKMTDQKFIEYQQTSYVNKAESTSKPNELLRDKVFLFNGGFYKWNFTENNWEKIETPVYEYVDYMTGVVHEWDQAGNEWKAKSQIAENKTEAQKTKPTTTTTKTESLSKEAKKQQTSDSSKKKEWFDINEEKNTNVYVSGLPLDITDEEFEEIMSKYGIIMKDPTTHKLKIKLYRENDEVKGDGRCCYLMPESVKLCLQLLDGSVYRGQKIKVEKAKFEMKGDFDPSKIVAPKSQKKKINKHKEKKLIEKQRQKLLDWEERPEIQRQKHEKVVVIKGLFTVIDAMKEKHFARKFADELRKELEEYGDVRKVLVHAKNPEGVATVSFKEVDMADACCEYLNNRVWKNGRIITCETWDGETKYDVGESEEEQQKRLSDWHKYLESDE